eukprot:gene13395-14625_t
MEECAEWPGEAPPSPGCKLTEAARGLLRRHPAALEPLVACGWEAAAGGGWSWSMELPPELT